MVSQQKVTKWSPPVYGLPCFHLTLSNKECPNPADLSSVGKSGSLKFQLLPQARSAISHRRSRTHSCTSTETRAELVIEQSSFKFEFKKNVLGGVADMISRDVSSGV